MIASQSKNGKNSGPLFSPFLFCDVIADKAHMYVAHPQDKPLM